MKRCCWRELLDEDRCVIAKNPALPIFAAINRQRIAEVPHHHVKLVLLSHCHVRAFLGDCFGWKEEDCREDTSPLARVREKKPSWRLIDIVVMYSVSFSLTTSPLFDSVAQH